MKNNQNTARQIWREFLRNESPALAAVAKAVARQMHGENSETLDELAYISESSCGIAGGYTGFIYYSDTVDFWRKNRAKITALINYEAESLGENPLKMVCRFRSLEGFSVAEIARALYGRYSDDLTKIYNTFAWFAAEEVAYRFAEYCYEYNVVRYSWVYE